VHHLVLAEGSKNPSVYDVLNNNQDIEQEKESTNGNLQQEQQQQKDDQDQSVLFGKSTNQPSGFELFLQLLFYLVIVIAMIYGLIKFLAVRQKKLQPNQLFQVMGGTQLGQNKSIQLVKVGESLYLLGVADQVNLIKEITNPQEITQIEDSMVDKESVMVKSFVDLLKSKLKTEEHTSNPSSFQSVFKQSIENQHVKREKLVQDLDNLNSKDKEGESM
jgi:flagellar protein FliO/FliZ